MAQIKVMVLLAVCPMCLLVIKVYNVHTMCLLNYIKDWVHVVQTWNLHSFAYNRYLRVTAGVDQVKLGTIGKFMRWCKQKI